MQGKISTDTAISANDEILSNQYLLLAAIVESSDDAIISKDLNGVIRSWNRGAERIFGYKAAEVVGKPVTILAAPDRVDEIPNILGRIRAGERIEHYETRRRAKDGRILIVSLTVSPIRDASGEIIGASKIARDITDAKQIEQERAAALAREQEARQISELLNRIGPLLASELNTQVLAQRVTDIATKLTGSQFGALFHNTVDDKGESYMLYTLSGVPPEAFSQFPMPRNTKVFAPTFAGEGIVRSDDITLDPRYGHNSPHKGMPAGHLPVRSYLAVPVITRAGGVLGGLFFGHAEPAQFNEQHEQLAAGIAAQAAIALDNARLFTESQKAQESLRKTNADLRRANEALEQFAFSASHDLKEPLRMVSIYSQILQRRYQGKLDREADEYLAYTIQGARRMESLVADLLEYTQAVSVLADDPGETNAEEVLAHVLGNLKGRIDQTQAVITHDPLLPVRIQEVHLLQVLQNLIGNALKYRGSEPPRIQVSATRAGELCEISVQDNGIGVAPEYRQQIFGIFKRLHNNLEYEGTGIGLAICQKIVERYGGAIWVESDGLTGSTFRFTLPAA